MRHCIPTHYSVGRPGVLGGERLRALCVVLFRSGLRVQEALDLEERDLDRQAKLITVRRGKGDRRRVVGMDDWAWNILGRWVELREEFPPGYVFCTLLEGHEGRQWAQSDVRRAMKKAGARAEMRRRCAPHQLRHGFCLHQLSRRRRPPESHARARAQSSRRHAGISHLDWCHRPHVAGHRPEAANGAAYVLTAESGRRWRRVTYSGHWSEVLRYPWNMRHRCYVLPGWSPASIER